MQYSFHQAKKKERKRRVKKVVNFAILTSFAHYFSLFISFLTIWQFTLSAVDRAFGVILVFQKLSDLCF